MGKSIAHAVNDGSLLKGTLGLIILGLAEATAGQVLNKLGVIDSQLRDYYIFAGVTLQGTAALTYASLALITTSRTCGHYLRR